MLIAACKADLSTIYVHCSSNKQVVYTTIPHNACMTHMVPQNRTKQFTYISLYILKSSSITADLLTNTSWRQSIKNTLSIIVHVIYTGSSL